MGDDAVDGAAAEMLIDGIARGTSGNWGSSSLGPRRTHAACQDEWKAVMAR